MHTGEIDPDQACVPLRFRLAYLAYEISSAVSANRTVKCLSIWPLKQVKYLTAWNISLTASCDDTKTLVYQLYLLQAFPQPPGGGPDCAALPQRSLGRGLLSLLLSYCYERPHRRDGSFQLRNGTQQQLARLQHSSGLDQRTISARKSREHCKTPYTVRGWRMTPAEDWGSCAVVYWKEDTF